MPRECWKHSGALAGLDKGGTDMRSIAPLPFCDYLNVTVPAERYEACTADLLEIVRAVGGRDAQDGLVRLGDGGTFVHRVKYGVGFYGLSGAAIAVLRDSPVSFNFWGEYLTVLGEGLHNVTRLDAALDVAADAAVVVGQLYRRARGGKFALTRKAIPPGEIRRVFAPAIAGGYDTGTVYLGARTRDVYAKVYDKRQELLQRAIDAHKGAALADIVALNDPGPLTRYELTLGRKVNVGLRDAYEPEAVFWHFAGESLAPLQRRRSGVPEWRAHGTGFAVPRSGGTDNARQLQLLLETSHDVRRAVTLADRLGPYGRDYLASLLRKMAPEPPPRPVPISAA